MQLRSHQHQLAQALKDKSINDLPLDILAWVVPGGGKSHLPGILANAFKPLKIGWFVPRLSLRFQACEALQKHFLIELREAENLADPSRGGRGFVATQQCLTALPELWIQEFKRNPYILVTDELHHAKIDPEGEPNELARVLMSLAPLAKIHLKMTGTLSTNDGHFIWGCKYDETPDGFIVNPKNSTDLYIRYPRETALTEQAIVPIEFYHHDGPARYIDRDGEKNVVLSMAKNRKEDRAGLYTALRTDFADLLRDAGINHFYAHGNQCVVVCAFQPDARRHYEILKKQGRSVCLAITEEGPEAQTAIRAFQKGQFRILVTVAMAYEGLDVPPITHIICLTHYRSIPWIEQMLARAWRWMPNKPRCWAFVPEDRLMQEVIMTIRKERPELIKPPEEGPPPPPTERFPIVPLHSDIDATRAEMLDGGVALSLIRGQVVEAFRNLGLAEDHPLIDDVVSATTAGRREQSKPGINPTVSEREQRLRKGIHGMCSAADKNGSRWSGGKEVSFGTHQKELHRRCRFTKFEEMSLEQLERAAEIATNLCA